MAEYLLLHPEDANRSEKIKIFEKFFKTGKKIKKVRLYVRRKEIKMNKCVVIRIRRSIDRFKPFNSEAKRPVKKAAEEKGKKKKSKSRRIPENMQEELAKARKKVLRRFPYRVLY